MGVPQRVAAVHFARCDFDAFDALSEERGANAGYLLDLMRAARSEMAADLDTAMALLPDPRSVGGYPMYLGQLHAGRARIMHNAGHEGRARDEFSRMREAMEQIPAARVVNGITLHGAALGSLDRVERIVKLGVFVNSHGDFIDQPKVANGASELMQQVFGEAGRHARSAVGVPVLPLGVAVEVDAVVAIKQ